MLALGTAVSRRAVGALRGRARHSPGGLWRSGSVNRGFHLMGIQRSSELRRAATSCFAIASIAGAAGCSLVVEAGKEQCATTLDCQVRGLEFAEAQCIDSLCQQDPTWACVTTVEPPATQAATTASMQVTNLLDQSGWADVHATLYAALDITMGTPIADAYTDADGRATLDIPAGFDGFVYLDNSELIEPVIFYPSWPVTTETGLGQVLATAPGGSVGLINLLGEVPQSGRGIALMAVRDCVGSGGTGARFEFQGETQGSTPFYAFNGIASSSAQSLDSSGAAGIVNVRPGVVGLDLRWGEKTVSSASVLIRADAVTQLTLLPGRSSRGALQAQ